MARATTAADAAIERTGSEVVPTADGAPMVIRPDVVEAYAAMVDAIPEAGTDGFEAILAAIADAEDVTELDSPWRSAGLEALRNVPLRFTALRRMPSEYAGGLPWFLVADAAVRSTGEKVTITTGAVSVVAQLVKAYSLGAFPLDAIPRVAERPSRNGYYPMHLEIVRA